MKLIFIGLFLALCVIDVRTEIDLMQLLKHILGPFMVSPRVKPPDTKRSSHSTLTSIQTLINKKLEQLKDLLQDNDEFDDFKEDYGHDRTTIIEFYPKIPKSDLRYLSNSSQPFKASLREPFKLDVEKYKKIKRKIDHILAKDTLSVKGKKIITNAFDDIINKMLKNQCTWKSVVESANTRRSEDMSAEAAMIAWKKQFKVLKQKYFEILQETEAPFSIEDLIQIFEGFNDFFSQVMNDINGMSKRYAIKCKLIDKKRKLQYTPLDKAEKEFPVKMYQVRSIDVDGPCKNFKICSSELAVFLTDLYKKVNETIYTAFKNYAAMYDRDVNTDNSAEGNLVIKIMNRIADSLEIKLQKTYKKKIHALTLDPNKDKQKNFKILNDFIKKVVETVNNTITKVLEKDFGQLSSKLRKSIKMDVALSMDSELRNLQNSTMGKVCSMFEECNGNVSKRRNYGGSLKDEDESMVFIQLKVNVSNPNTPSYLRSQPRDSLDQVPFKNQIHSKNQVRPKIQVHPKNQIRHGPKDQIRHEHQHVSDNNSSLHQTLSHSKVIVTRTTTVKKVNNNSTVKEHDLETQITK